MRALVGARSKNDVLCGEDFSRSNVPVEVATEDGSYGHRGLVTDLLRRHLELAAKNKNPSRVFSCGPLPMLSAVAQLCIQKNVPCQVSLEENMPCGVGICNGCVVPVVGAGDEYGRYRRVCVEGPVMRAQEIDWLHES
jgi:dihydroorotate dehydrogenase electron transfer subunit